MTNLDPEDLTLELQSDAQHAYDRREAELSPEVMREVERRVVMSVLDRKWREHLYEMDYLQEGIGLRAMAQRDPVVEYSREGYQMFNAMLEGIKEESVGFFFNVDVQIDESRLAPEEDEEGGVAIRGGDLGGPRKERLHYSAPSADGTVEERDDDSRQDRRTRRAAKRAQRKRGR